MFTNSYPLIELVDKDGEIQYLEVIQKNLIKIDLGKKIAQIPLRNIGKHINFNYNILS
jgi:hypothetical protein